jgi:hypothetical protein
LELRYGLRDKTYNHFAFFHVGQDISAPQKMVKSILRYNPDAFVVMFTDDATPDVMGITHRLESEVNREELCYHRIKAYAERAFDKPTLYLDTDMLVQGKIDVEELLGGGDTAFCRRRFQRDMFFNIEQRGLKFPEYEGKTIDQVYPYVGCAVVSRKNEFWKSLLNIYDSLDPKFRKWYGDQEAMRIYAEKYGVAEIPESIYGCLPEHKTDDAKIIHYKGGARKKLFEDV